MGSKVQSVYDGLAGQKNDLSLALKSGGSAVQDIIDKTTRIEGQAADVQGELAGVNNRIKGEKAQKVALEGQIGKINSTVAQLEGEVGNLEGVLKSAEQDRADKDDQIKTLKDEIGHQADMISKLGKEKRNVGDGRQKTEEDIQAAEDKCNHLSKVKGKLEQALDESEDALEREKKVKGDVDKSKRKIEGDLKLTQEAVSDLERVKAELGGGVARKEKEGSALSAKIDDEATLASKYAKQAKELLARLEELDEELVIERGSRAKAEKGRTMLKKDIEDIASRLEEAGSNTDTQVELNKEREAELGRIKAELEELNIAQEVTLAALRMKHNNSMGDLGEQIDSLNSSKVKSEKDKAGMELDLRDARLDLEDAVKGKAELDKTGKLLQGSIVDSNTRLGEMARALNEAESTKKRLQVENQDLNRQIEELEAATANLLGGLLLLLLLLLGIGILLRLCLNFLNGGSLLDLGLLLDGDEQANDVLGLDHVVLIDLELTEDVVDLSLGHLVSPGLEGVLEHLGVNLAVVVVSLEGLDNEVVGVVALAGHLLLEHLDHVVVGAGSRDLAQQSVELRPAHEDTDVVEGSTQVIFVQLAILVDVHKLEAVLVHLQLILGEPALILALAHFELLLGHWSVNNSPC